MCNKKIFFAKLVTLSMVASVMLCTPVMAASKTDIHTEKGVVKTITETGKGTVIEGVVQQSIGVNGIQSRWLAPGPIRRFPAEGGLWEYGFWYAKARSYYTVNRNHGSTVIVNQSRSRSIDTAPNRRSIAELWAVQSNSHDSYYYRVN